ncbi:discoidin domain-containing protein [Reichenbachiella carrageenanivorans]|uniref:Discoidin domain-containing protein n=1 Tax=Reichenbachiella carrageenanivorans TaxID=2979869 RepID=A0ABY6D231_9BACT|nr:discoidin domain-containing protein [Reichenbachiella carrageenanivorans]UXX79804.1 discoidin domain-containing protein [Reichenbachiella carrageenanivorans]
MKTKLTAFLTLFLVAGLMIQSKAQQHDYGQKSYGIFVHYGWGGTAASQYGCPISPYPDWTYPQNVDETANNFDVQGFVDDLEDMNPEYLIFTAWHCWQHPLYPSDVMDSWLGTGHCSQRDVLQELLDACDAIGLDVYWYIQPSEAHNFSPAEQAAVGYIDRNTQTETYNDFLNELIAELTDRYKSQVKGFWFDKGLSYGCTDTERIGNTIRAILPNAVLIANGFANESADFGALETKVPSVTFPRDGYIVSNSDEDTWPGYERSVSFVMDRSWAAEPGSIRYDGTMMFKYTVLQAGVNEEGGGVAWAYGPYPGIPVSYNPGLKDAMVDLGNQIDEVGESIKNTVPSNSWPSPEGTTINSLEWGIATRSADGDFEYLHVLKAPVGNTLTIAAPDDGRQYTSAVNLRTGNACSFSQTSNEINITLAAGDTWHAIDAVIKLTYSGITIGGGNLALNGTASQSSTDYGGVASRAIDGTTDGAWSEGSVTHTVNEVEPWWEVDLGSEHIIGDIVIYNRTDVPYNNRLSNFTVTVMDGNRNATFSQSFTSYPDPSIIVDGGNAVGQIIQVKLDDTNPLSLAEVEVYEGEIVESNLALSGTATQSSTAYAGAASRAIDNDTNGVWEDGSVTHTSPEANPWWEVDLGSEYSIGDINIFGRTDECCAGRLSDYTLSVIDGNGVTTYTENFTTYPEATTNAGDAIGQVIRIQSNTTDVALSLAEVQVYEGGGSSPVINTITIQENETGFCSVEGGVHSNNAGYTGDGFANTSNVLGNGVNWEISGAAGDYTFSWRYASTNSRPGDLLVSGATVANNVLSSASGSWSSWITVSTTVTLGAGVKTVRLEATSASGLGNIDYMEVTGPDAAVSGCSSGARVGGSDVLSEVSASVFNIYPNPVEGQLNIKLEKGEHAHYHVLNTSGQVVMTGHISNGAATVDLNDFKKGIYLIKVTGDSTSQIRKVIKK